MYREIAELLQTETLAVFERVPGASFDGKIEFVANVLGIAGFALSVGLLIFGAFQHSGRRRLATRADLDHLSAAVVNMIGDRIAGQLADATFAPAHGVPVLLEGQQGDTYERVRTDLMTAVAAIAGDRSDQAQAAATALLGGQTEQAERLLEQRADASRNDNAAACAESLHLKAALQSTHDLAGALRSCQQAIRVAPESASGWNRLGHLYLRLGMVSEARMAFDQALAIEIAGEPKQDADRRTLETSTPLSISN